ncbi:MAG: AAA family ATPase [Aliarcobacter sp.]|nr:AAA family ATPase [Aliarcobacter sp.]
MTLYEGYEFYKSVQGTKYDVNDLEKKEKLQEFRNNLGNFTDKIFKDRHSLLALEKGMWQNSGNFTKYMWNRYKYKDDNSSLVIYFNASTNEEGLFVSIGLIDNKLSELEKINSQKIYDYLEQECKKINSIGFERKNTGWGERVFSVIDKENFETLDYDDLIQKLKKIYDDAYKKFYLNQDNNTKNRVFNMFRQSLNQILFGPPGTGKTFNTINKALEIIDSDFFQANKDDRKALKDKFEEHKKAGQIEFVTFHQSYGYEEFVEGIKADLDSDEIKYKLEKGIFRKLSNLAELNYRKSIATIETKKDFDTLFKEQILDKLIDDEKLKISTPKKHFFITEVNEKTIFFEKAEGQTDHSLSIRTLKEMYESGKNEKIKGGLSVYYEPILNFLLENSLFDKVDEEPLKNHILIIDEINRGNISKIFGELITLIEPSKRIGAEEEIKVKLPYSNDEFGVPQNLYIIGTMNTADRSIALMDTALRRRFEFIEMLPDLEVLKGIKVEEIEIYKLLEIINKRVEYLYDRDHTIGHAYFMSLKENATLEELENIFKNKIIPLLQEYFYDDWEKILMVLGNGFIEKKDISDDIFDYKVNDYLEEEKSVYKIKDKFDFSSFK